MNRSLAHIALFASVITGMATAHAQSHVDSTIVGDTPLNCTSESPIDFLNHVSVGVGNRCVGERDPGLVPAADAVIVGNGNEFDTSDVIVGHGNRSNDVNPASGAGNNTVGRLNNVEGANNNVHGLNNQIRGTNNIVAGSSVEGTGSNMVLFGTAARGTADGCVAIGGRAECVEADEFSIGNTIQRRRLTNVRDGRDEFDAATVGQLRHMTETLGAGATVVNGVIVAPNYQLISGKHYSTVAGAIYDLDGRVHQLEQNPGGGGGATGPQGPQGPTGPQGPAGQDGKDGKDGGSSTAVAGANIEVTDNGDGTQTVALKDTIELSEQGSVQVAKAIHNSDGFTVQGGPSVTRSGINAGNQRVTGVAAGAIAPGSTDAINGGQLWDYQRQQDDRWNLTDRRFRQLDKRVSGVCAMAQANAQMATSTSAIHGENRNRLAVGVGGCSGQAAISIGYTRDVTTPRGSPSAFSIGVSRSGQDTAVGAAWAIGW